MGGMLRAIEDRLCQKRDPGRGFTNTSVPSKPAMRSLWCEQIQAGRGPDTCHSIDEHIERDQVDTPCKAVRAARDGNAADTALASVEAAARGTESLLPRILTAVEARVTVRRDQQHPA